VTTLSERISFCPGVDAVAALDDKTKRFYYPRPGWKPLSEAGVRALLGAGIPRPSETIYLLSIAQHLPPRFRQLFPRPFVGRPRVHRRNRHSSTSSSVIDEILASFDDTFLDEECYSLETVVNVGPCRSTTADPLLGNGIGLHLDSGSRLPLNARHRAIPRCGLNLGTHPRYFVFVNLTVEMILKLLPGVLSEDDLNSTPSPWPLLIAFFSMFPNYPVLRLKLHPGEGYVAPTQSLIHDGQFDLNMETDLNLLIRPSRRTL
jgi:hypothetical protein